MARHCAFALLALTAAALLAAQRPALQLDELRRMVPMDLDPTAAVALGDVDADGDLDAVIGNSGKQNRLWLNDGAGRLADATARIPVDTDQTMAVGLGDVDGDGDLDVLIGNGGSQSSGQQNRLWINDGSGRFADATTSVPVGSDATAAVALGDLDGDGDLDVLIGNGGPSGRQNRLWLNDGNGTFTDATHRVPTFQDWTMAVALGDVDNDGDLDALIGNLLQDRLWLNDGAGRFSDATTRIPTGTDPTVAVAFGDVDADGDLDVLTGASGSRRNRLWINDGSGCFTDATTRVPSTSGNTTALALGDVDGDGDLDVLVGNRQDVRATGQSGLWLNDGTGGFTDGTAGVPTESDRTAAVALGDLDGDGDLDALLGNVGQNRLWLNDGSGRFGDATSSAVATRTDNSEAVALGDVDGDGDLDALIGNPIENRLWINDGTGRFDEASARIPVVPIPTSALALGDVDGDGDLDALIGNWGRNRLWLNDGSGRFTDAAGRIPGQSEHTRGLALGDVDGDGDLDPLIGDDPWVRLWVNDGSGRFTDATDRIPPNLDSTRAVVLGDVDTDGDLDAMVANTSPRNRLWLNDGAGRFIDASDRIPIVLQGFSWSVALGDVDGDGDLDALLGVLGSRNQLWINDGTGRFAAAQVPTARWTSCVALGDLDGDGDLDAVIGNVGQQNRLWINDGTGRLRDASARLPTTADQTWAIALGDLDGDGDLDAVVGNTEDVVQGNTGQNRVYANLTRQVAARALPRVGKPLTIDVYGSPFGFWLLLASSGTADIRLPVGTLRLDPTRHVQVAAGLLDPQGRASHADRVPADASLVGISVHWQAIVSVPLALTNLETTTFTNL